MIDGFHSAVVEVADFEAATDDYARLFGRAPLRIERHGVEGSTSALFALANMQLEIRRSDRRPNGSTGLAGIRLRTDDLERCLEGLEARGVACDPPVVHESEALGGGAKRSWRSAAIDAVASRGTPVEIVCDDAGGSLADDDAGAAAEGRTGVVPGSSVRALDHVVVLSADADATRDFYGEGLGIRLALDRTFEGRGVRLLFFRLGGVTIEIGSRLSGEARPDARDGFGGLAWQVPDIESIQSRLKTDGFDVSGIREGNKPGTRVCTVRDPVHGVPTLLIEPVS